MMYLKNFWKNAFNFSGVTKLKEYWIIFLINLAFYVVPIFLLAINITVYEVYAIIYFVASIVPMTAISVRRLHDTDRSGLNLLWALFPIVGWIMIIFYLLDKSRYNYEEITK